ncbi:hypothetical protein FHW89_000032 [Mucilaginibacter sp. SG564]|nr:hypothetical protein [Mucilaginibacter sp. SG564]
MDKDSNPMSLRGGTTKQSRSYSLKHILTAQSLFNAPKFRYICIYNGPVTFLKKGNRAVLVKENRAKNRSIYI